MTVRARGLDDERVAITVEDTGVGIPQEALATVFDRFTQAETSTSRRYGGSGLGLAIVKGLVEAMQGTVSVRSREGEGTCFTVELPLPEFTEDAPVQRRSAPAVTPKVERNRDVLVIEDHWLNIETLKIVLDKLGYRPSVVLDRKAAIEAAGQKPYGTILLDTQMPGLNDELLLRSIRKAQSDSGFAPARVIAFDVDLTRRRAEEFELWGFDGVIGRPINIDRLNAILADEAEDVSAAELRA